MFKYLFGKKAADNHDSPQEILSNQDLSAGPVVAGTPIVCNIPNREPIVLTAYYKEFLWYYPNCEMQTKQWFVDNVLQDWVILDCGANIGYFTILFSQLARRGHIHAFEPTSTFELLRHNLAYNKIENATVHKIALGMHVGRRRDKVFRIWGDAPEEREYNFTTIDHFVASEKINVDCIKIDVDSFDFEVLKGAKHTLKNMNPRVVVELNHALGKRNQQVTEALEWMSSLGYKSAIILDKDNFLFHRDTEFLDDTHPSSMTLFFSK